MVLTFQVLDLLDVVCEAAAGQHEEELEERDDEGEEGADEEQRLGHNSIDNSWLENPPERVLA